MPKHDSFDRTRKDGRTFGEGGGKGRGNQPGGFHGHNDDGDDRQQGVSRDALQKAIAAITTRNPRSNQPREYQALADLCANAGVGLLIASHRDAIKPIIEEEAPVEGHLALAGILNADSRRDDRARERNAVVEVLAAEFYAQLQAQGLSWDHLFVAVGYEIRDRDTQAVINYGFDCKGGTIRQGPSRLRFRAAHPKPGDELDPAMTPEELEAAAQLLSEKLAERDRSLLASPEGASVQDLRAARIARLQQQNALVQAQRSDRVAHTDGDGPSTMAEALADAGVTAEELEAAPLNDEAGASDEAEERMRAEQHQDRELEAQA